MIICKKKTIRKIISDSFMKERSVSNIDNCTLFDSVKAKVINEQSSFPSLMSFLGALFSFIFVTLFLKTDLGFAFVSTFAIGFSILIGIPLYWYTAISNPYSDLNENKKEKLDKEKEEEVL